MSDLTVEYKPAQDSPAKRSHPAAGDGAGDTKKPKLDQGSDQGDQMSL
jgi:hypothetical protein